MQDVEILSTKYNFEEISETTVEIEIQIYFHLRSIEPTSLFAKKRFSKSEYYAAMDKIHLTLENGLKHLARLIIYDFNVRPGLN
jgi:hypothetical protein